MMKKKEEVGTLKKRGSWPFKRRKGNEEVVEKKERKERKKRKEALRKK